jgi:tetratricopeptide (TPR) repeat protein
MLRNKSIRVITLFFSVFLLPLFVVSQNLDSLKARVNAAPEKERFEVIVNYVQKVLNSDPANALGAAIYGIEFAKDTRDSLLIAKALYTKGFVMRRLTDPNEAIPVLLKSVEICKRNKFEEQLKKGLNVLANSYMYAGDYDSSLEYHFQSLLLNERINDLEALSVTENNIGVVYFKLLDFENALLHYENALEIKEKNGFSYDYESLVINIALCYNQLKKYGIAESKILRVLKNCKDGCSDDVKMQGESALGISYLELGKYSESEKCLLKSLELSKRLNDKRVTSENYFNLSLVYSALNQREKSLLSLTEAEKISLEIGYSQLLVDVYKRFSLVYDYLKDYKKEAFYSKRYISIKDSIYSKEAIKNLAVIQGKYVERENNFKIAHQQEVLKLQEETVRRQQWIIALVGTSVLLVAVVAWLLYRSNRMRKKVNILLESKVQERTYQLQESHSTILSQSAERNKEVAQAYNKLTALKATLKGVINIGKKETDPRSVNECLEEVDKAVDRMEEIAKQHLTSRK